MVFPILFRDSCWKLCRKVRYPYINCFVWFHRFFSFLFFLCLFCFMPSILVDVRTCIIQVCNLKIGSWQVLPRCIRADLKYSFNFFFSLSLSAIYECACVCVFLILLFLLLLLIFPFPFCRILLHWFSFCVFAACAAHFTELCASSQPHSLDFCFFRMTWPGAPALTVCVQCTAETNAKGIDGMQW